jgi:hypothetical protein
MPLKRLDSAHGLDLLKDDGGQDPVAPETMAQLTEWFKTTLGKSVSDVKVRTMW